jgi:hypothetical protein
MSSSIIISGYASRLRKHNKNRQYVTLKAKRVNLWDSEVIYRNMGILE